MTKQRPLTSNTAVQGGTRLLLFVGILVLVTAFCMIGIKQLNISLTTTNGPAVGPTMPTILLPAFGGRNNDAISHSGDEVICVYRSECPFCKRVLPDVVRTFGRSGAALPVLVLVQEDGEVRPAHEVTEAGWRGTVYRDPEKKTTTLLSVKHVPTFLVFHNGLLKASYLGVVGWEDLKDSLLRSTSGTPPTPNALHVAKTQADPAVTCRCDSPKEH